MGKPLKLRLKAEAKEFDEQPSSFPQVPAIKSEHQGNDAAVPPRLPSEDNLLQIPSVKATLADFPPGCPILYTDTSITPFVVTKGFVEQVFIDLSPGALRDYYYKLSLGTAKTSIIVSGTELQWAPHCPVWLRMQHEDPECSECCKRAATIMGSYQGNAKADKLFSLQEVEPGTGLFHGVTKECIQYRSVDSTYARQHVAPSSSGSEEASFNGRIDSSQTRRMSHETGPMLAVSSTPVPKKPQDHISRGTTRVTSSPRKRPITENLVENVENSGLDSCSAEFRMPRWMKAVCLDDGFIHQVCQLIKDCTECQATILESSRQSSTLAGQSIFVYGKNMFAVDQAIAAVSDLLQEYVNTDDKERLTAELSTGWRKDSHENADKMPKVSTEANGNSETSSSVWRDAGTSFKKKAKRVRSPSEEGEIKSVTSDAESPSKVLFQIKGSVPDDAERCPPPQQAAKNEGGTEHALSAELAATLQNMDVEQEDATDSAAESEYSIQTGLVTRILKVPRSADDRLVKEALVGTDERIRNYIIGETGCKIEVKFDPIEVLLTGTFDAGDFDFAQRWVENRIVSTVPDDQKGRMLFHIARDNDYGASEGHARYQRSPHDLKSWVWMNVVEVPDGFEACGGLFVDKNGKGMKEIIRSTGCRHIQLCDTLPKHIFICSGNLEMVNAATKAVKDRVLWALNEFKKRNYKKKW